MTAEEGQIFEAFLTRSTYTDGQAMIREQATEHAQAILRLASEVRERRDDRAPQEASSPDRAPPPNSDDDTAAAKCYGLASEPKVPTAQPPKQEPPRQT